MGDSRSLGGQGKSCVVVGGGLVGCMSGLLLARTGYDVKIYEMREGEWRKANWPPGRQFLHMQISCVCLTSEHGDRSTSCISRLARFDSFPGEIH